MADTQPVSSSSQPTFLNEKPQNSILNNKYLWATLVVCSIILFVATVLCFCKKKKILAAFKRRMENKKDKIDANELMLRKFQLEELEIATNNFAKEFLIGSGAFGNVYKGTFEGDITLAIKKARDDSYTSTKEFRNEVKLISKVKHRNLVGLVGYCEETGTKGVQILVYEYVSNGSLLEHIVGRDREPLTWRQRVNIAIQAAKGKHARPHLERGSVEEIIDTNLLLEPCNMDVMLKMGLLGLRCVVKEPKQRPTMTQVYKELEAALWSANGSVRRQWPSRSIAAPGGGRSMEIRDGQATDQDSSVSLDGVGLQRFRVEMDSISFQSTSLRCLEADSFVFHVDSEGKTVDEEMSLCMDDYLSIPRD
ncbi:protein kinase-like domain, Concanavalin A-like lectin/glucanase domain protein [Artemisia annua]|uniref:non-specific serine/threonine protein kinase n=1 Tax=Artemisia annua TaxID=35608 RepID=A0A2U1MLB1_ARTAN|nr:protein kinase-like domain, Concanavalin A-like lectin/glucanase domain protein [Artemisia annua]